MICVDPIFDAPGPRGMNRWSHMGTTDHSDAGLAELHGLASRIGMKREWFQDKPGHPHYDLVPSRRDAAVKSGAVEVMQRQYAQRCSARLARVKATREAGNGGPPVLVVADGHDQFLAFLAKRDMKREHATEVIHANQLRGVSPARIVVFGDCSNRSDWPAIREAAAWRWRPEYDDEPGPEPEPAPTSESGQLSLF